MYYCLFCIYWLNTRINNMTSFRRRQQRTYHVQVGQQLLILDAYIVPNTTYKTQTSVENTHKRSCDWFTDNHLHELVRSVETAATTRVYSAKPVSTRTCHYLANSNNIITPNLKIQYYFKRRSVAVQHFTLLKIHHLNEETRNKENNTYRSLPFFHEKLVVIVQQNVTEKIQQPVNVQVLESAKDKEKAVKKGTSSDYFTGPTDCLITSAVKRKKTSLKMMSKKSKIALLKTSLSCADSMGSSETSTKEQSSEEIDNLSTQKSSSNNSSQIKPEQKIQNNVIDLDEIPEGLNDVGKVEDLRSDHLKFMVNNMEEYLRAIFCGKVYSRRHEDYKKGGKCRDNLNFQVGMAHFTDDQHDCIMNALMALFRYKLKYIDYVTKVMLPEALIKLYQDVHQTNSKQAEERLLNDTVC